jgi:hypothetical protein
MFTNMDNWTREPSPLACGAGRSLAGMVLSTIPAKNLENFSLPFLCDLCGLERAKRVGVR